MNYLHKPLKMYNTALQTKEKIMADMNKALKLCRLYSCMTHAELAENLGFNSATITSEIETGKRTPSNNRIKQYAEWLGVQPSDLVKFSEKIGDFNDKNLVLFCEMKGLLNERI